MLNYAVRSARLADRLQKLCYHWKSSAEEDSSDITGRRHQPRDTLPLSRRPPETLPTPALPASGLHNSDGGYRVPPPPPAGGTRRAPQQLALCILGPASICRELPAPPRQRSPSSCIVKVPIKPQKAECATDSNHLPAGQVAVTGVLWPLRQRDGLEAVLAEAPADCRARCLLWRFLFILGMYLRAVSSPSHGEAERLAKKICARVARGR